MPFNEIRKQFDEGFAKFKDLPFEYRHSRLKDEIYYLLNESENAQPFPDKCKDYLNQSIKLFDDMTNGKYAGFAKSSDKLSNEEINIALEFISKELLEYMTFTRYQLDEAKAFEEVYR